MAVRNETRDSLILGEAAAKNAIARNKYLIEKKRQEIIALKDEIEEAQQALKEIRRKLDRPAHTNIFF
jgi:hypothetical protein